MKRAIRILCQIGIVFLILGLWQWGFALCAIPFYLLALLLWMLISIKWGFGEIIRLYKIIVRWFKSLRKITPPPAPLMLPAHIEEKPIIEESPKVQPVTEECPKLEGVVLYTTLEDRFREFEKKEIARKLKERQRRRELEREVYEELIAKGELYEESGRPPIPRDVRDIVWRRDGGKCVQCGSTKNLQFDHIIPFSKGGATSAENLQILCQKCNLEKSNKIG